MFQPVSQQKQYTLFSSFDPALDLPTVPRLDDDASADEKAERDKIAEERVRKFETAIDGSNPSSVCKSGQSPSLFTCTPIHGVKSLWLIGEIRRRQLLEVELAALAFRLGVKKCDIKGIDLGPDKFEVVDGHHMMTQDALDQFYSIGRDTDPSLGAAIVIEIGGLIWARAQGVRPLS